MYTLYHTTSMACTSYVIIVPHVHLHTQAILELVFYLMIRYVLGMAFASYEADCLLRCFLVCSYGTRTLYMHLNTLKNTTTKPGIALTLSYTIALVFDFYLLHDCVMDRATHC